MASQPDEAASSSFLRADNALAATAACPLAGSGGGDDDTLPSNVKSNALPGDRAGAGAGVSGGEHS